MQFSIIIKENKIKTSFWLIIGSFLVFLAGNYPGFVEKWYALGFYPLYSKMLRFSFGWVGFSMGDLLYTLLGAWLLLKLLRLFSQIYRRQFGWPHFFNGISILIRAFCLLYIVFNIVWGLNYHRLGIAHQLKVENDHYSKEEITAITNDLIEKANYYRKAINAKELPIYSFEQIKKEAVLNYQSAEIYFPFLHYQSTSIKASSYNSIADYIGFTGYYNPFTAEAQLRTDVPPILIPFTTCHEIAHQLGYASESEANFVGFLTASNSNSAYFRYSAYLEMLNYALSEEFIQYAKDSSFKALEQVMLYNKSHIDTLVKKDRKEIRQFFLQRRNKIAPVSAGLYDQYLKWNKQLAGINSYDEVIGWLIAYKKVKGNQF
jgi:hypothetical protein